MARTTKARLDKRKAFAREYVVSMNATAAAKKAGYSPKSAHLQGCLMLKDPDVRAEISRLQAPAIKEAKVDAFTVLTESLALATSDIRKFFKDDGTLKALTELDDQTAAAVASVKVKAFAGNDDRQAYTIHEIKFWDKNAALERLMRHLNLLKPEDREVKVTVEVRQAAINRLSDDELRQAVELSRKLRALREVAQGLPEATAGA